MGMDKVWTRLQVIDNQLVNFGKQPAKCGAKTCSYIVDKKTGFFFIFIVESNLLIMLKICNGFQCKARRWAIKRPGTANLFTLFLLFFSIFLGLHDAHAQVGIGTSSPNPSAALEVNSSSKGMLVPRMLEAQKNAILAPAQGLLIYQTNPPVGFYYYNNGWIYINSVGPQGANGKNTLVKTTTEPAGANCATGGVKLEFGLDVNDNNVLDAAEINALLTKYVCNGTGFSHYIGEVFAGGVVFHVWRDAAGAEHGLIVALTNLASSSVWSNVGATSIGAASQNTWDGLNNSLAITGQPGHTQSAAAQCLSYVSNGQTDWYLPSYAEMSLLWTNLFNVNKTLSVTGAASQISLFSYWTSTEDNDSQAFSFTFSNGSPTVLPKSVSLSIRAIRSF
jgi:Protein of unknown function (DUF1566)